MNTFEWIGALSGLVGGFSGVLALGIQLWVVHLSGYRVTAQTSYELSPRTGGTGIGITLVNRGRLPVTVSSVSLEMPTLRHLPLGSFSQADLLGPRLPAVLDMHSSLDWMAASTALLDLDEVRVAGRLRVRADLATGRTVRSRNWVDVAGL